MKTYLKTFVSWVAFLLALAGQSQAMVVELKQTCSIDADCPVRRIEIEPQQRTAGERVLEPLVFQREVFREEPEPEATLCSSNADCEDADACTFDFCKGLSDVQPGGASLGRCVHVAICEDIPPPPQTPTPTAGDEGPETPSETPETEAEPASPPATEQPEAPVVGATDDPAPEPAALPDFPDCRIPPEDVLTREPSDVISQYGLKEFAKCARAGGGAGNGLEDAALPAQGGCSLIREDR